MNGDWLKKGRSRDSVVCSGIRVGRQWKEDLKKIKSWFNCCPLSSKILWAAVMVGFFFLLRASEFLVCNARSWSGKRVLKGVNVEGRKGNKVCASLSEADEVVIFLAGSKTDQYNQGRPTMCGGGLGLLSASLPGKIHWCRRRGAIVQIHGWIPHSADRHPEPHPTLGTCGWPGYAELRKPLPPHRRGHGSLPDHKRSGDRQKVREMELNSFPWLPVGKSREAARPGQRHGKCWWAPHRPKTQERPTYGQLWGLQDGQDGMWWHRRSCSQNGKNKSPVSGLWCCCVTWESDSWRRKVSQSNLLRSGLGQIWHFPSHPPVPRWHVVAQTQLQPKRQKQESSERFVMLLCNFKFYRRILYQCVQRANALHAGFRSWWKFQSPELFGSSKLSQQGHLLQVFCRLSMSSYC